MPLIRLMSTGDRNTTTLLRGTILEPEGALFDQIVCLIKVLMQLITIKEKHSMSGIRQKHVLKDFKKIMQRRN